MPSEVKTKKKKKVLQEEGGAVRMLLIEGETQETAFHLEEAASYSDIGNAISAALRHRYRDTGKSVWPADIFPDVVVYQIYSHGKKTLYRSSYTYDESRDEATISEEMEQVIRQTTYEPVPKLKESGSPALVEGFTALSLAEVDPKKHDLIRLITPGKGSSGFYSEDVLKRAAETKAFPAGLPLFVDHATLQERREKPERSWRDMAGHTITDAFWKVHEKAGPGLYAYANFCSGIRGEVREKKDFSGLSVVADGTIREGNVEEITRGFSCDLVTFPGRGGKVVQLAESDRTRAAEMQLHETIHLVEADSAAADEPSTPPPEPPSVPVAGESITESQTEDDMSGTADKSQTGAAQENSREPSSALVREAKTYGDFESMTLEEARRTAASFLSQNQALDARNSTLQSELKEAKTQAANLQLENNRLSGKLEKYRVRDFVEEKLKEQDSLDPVLRERLLSQLILVIPSENGDIKEAEAIPIIEKRVKEELDFYEKLTGAGSVRGNGGAPDQSLEEIEAELAKEFAAGGMSEAAARAAASSGRRSF